MLITSVLVHSILQTPAAKLHVIPHTSAERVSIFQGTTGQTANLTEWRDDTGTAHATVNADGEFTNTNGFAQSEVFGDGATAVNITGTAFGYGASSERDGVAIGNLSSTTARFGVAIGSNATAGSNGVAIGPSVTAATNGTVVGTGASGTCAFGQNASAGGTSVAIGQSCTALDDSVAVGTGATNNSTNSTALGSYAKSASLGVSVGRLAGNVTVGIRSTNIGYNTQTSQDSIALGYQASAVGNKNNIAIGNNCTITSENGIGIGHNLTAGGKLCCYWYRSKWK